MKRVAWLLAAILAVSAHDAAPVAAAPEPKPATPTTPAAPELDRLSADLQALSRRVSPAVVQVFASSLVPMGGGGGAAGGLLSRQRGLGSGVIVDAEGFIVTNAHVVMGARRVQVQLAEPRSGSPGRSVLKPAGARLEARIVGLDRESDLAVLKIDGRGLPTLPFADSDSLRQGQMVLAFGSPLGLESSVSMGIISAPVRQIEPDAPMIYLQTDAAINPGNSGGPLVDTRGAVVGINAFIMGSAAGNAVGFAAPSNIVNAVQQQIRKHGRVRRGEIGVRVQTVTPELASGLGLERDWGAILADVQPGGPGGSGGAQGRRPGREREWQGHGERAPARGQSVPVCGRRRDFPRHPPRRGRALGAGDAQRAPRRPRPHRFARAPRGAPDRAASDPGDPGGRANRSDGADARALGSAGRAQQRRRAAGRGAARSRAT